jgi:hypothetical protein
MMFNRFAAASVAAAWAASALAQNTAVTLVPNVRIPTKADTDSNN